jgi:hypothetical protein
MRRMIFILSGWTLIFMFFLYGMFLVAVAYAGRSSQEIFDYLNHRLYGHTKLEFVFNPIIDFARLAHDDIPKAARMGMINKMQAARYPERNIIPASKSVLVFSDKSVKQYATISEAALYAPSGAVVEISAGDYTEAQAVWKQKEITIRGIGGPVRLFAGKKSAEGKAIWVFRTGKASISGIGFFDAKVHDMNGAGVRAEKGDFSFDNVHFENNESGILTTAAVGTLTVDRSTFINNGNGDGYSHAIYAGKIDLLVVTRSVFYNTIVGHHIKSRAASSFVQDSKFYDELGLVSYELNFPNGGEVFVLNNYLEQNNYNENSVMLSYGEEGLLHKVNTLTVNKSTFRNVASGGTFVRTVIDSDKSIIENSRFMGNGIIDSRSKLQHSANNIWVGNLLLWKNTYFADNQYKPALEQQKLELLRNQYCGECSVLAGETGAFGIFSVATPR